MFSPSYHAMDKTHSTTTNHYHIHEIIKVMALKTNENPQPKTPFEDHHHQHHAHPKTWSGNPNEQKDPHCPKIPHLQ